MSTNWQLTAGQMITRAYRILGNLTAPWTPSADQMTQGLIALNGMLKGWQIDGINLYRQEQYALTIPPGVGYAGNPFDVQPLILGLEAARWVITPAPNLYERPLGVFSYIDYMNLPNKMATAQAPSVICLDKQVGASQLYFWPLPTFGGVCNATVGRTINDVNTAQDTLDFPTEWTEGAIYNLADRLMDDQGTAAADPETAQRITVHAATFYQKLLAYDRPDSLWMRPYGSKGSGRFWR